MIFYVVLASVLSVAQSQSRSDYTTPVPILKQIDKHNEDGSYSYGYEAADGTYKIETKYPNGEVYGKYGFVDDQGKLRTVEYGASRRGFEPAGNEIQVAPPTLKIDNQFQPARPLAPNEEDDGQYREDPGVYYKNDPDYRESPRSQYKPRYEQPRYEQSRYEQPRYEQPRYEQPRYEQPRYEPKFESRFDQPSYRPQPAFRPEPRWSPQPSYYNPPPPPAYPNYNQFSGHPAQNVDINSGSYTVNYR